MFFDCATLEGLHLLGLERKPAFGVAVDGGLVASLAKSHSSGRASAANQALILVFRVNGADRAVFLLESDGKELALGCGDELVDFGDLLCVHGFGLFDVSKIFGNATDGKKKD